ncbi:MAG: hypothetical protein HY308_05025 [Gammaproteobacteria bacterium]|nr:hypothetical protein [Gammaproteobacteria bacterium]
MNCHRRLLLALKYVWASPASVVGLALALVVWAGGAKMAVIDGVLEVGGGRVGYGITRLPACRFSAITFGHVVIGIDGNALIDCRAHERVHVRQYERWGVLFFPLYLGSSLWQLLCGRNPYWDNYFERQAYRQTGEP